MKDFVDNISVGIGLIAIVIVGVLLIAAAVANPVQAAWGAGITVGVVIAAYVVGWAVRRWL